VKLKGLTEKAAAEEEAYMVEAGRQRAQAVANKLRAMPDSPGARSIGMYLAKSMSAGRALRRGRRCR